GTPARRGANACAAARGSSASAGASSSSRITTVTSRRACGPSRSTTTRSCSAPCPESTDGGSMIPRENLLREFEIVASEAARRPISQVDTTRPIADLGIDSVAALEVVGLLEERLGIHIPDDQLATMVTVDDLLKCVEQARGASA